MRSTPKTRERFRDKRKRPGQLHLVLDDRWATNKSRRGEGLRVLGNVY